MISEPAAQFFVNRSAAELVSSSFVLAIAVIGATHFLPAPAILRVAAATFSAI